MTFIVDFDGTISLKDTLDELLNIHADVKWKIFEERWEKGEISARTCLQEQLRLINLSLEEFNHFIDQIDLDPDFPLFLAEVTPKTEVIIVSDGLDYVIKRKLVAFPRLKIFSSTLHWTSHGFNLEFPYAQPDCASATCKTAIANLYPKPTILIGDGRSDYCLAKEADLVFAKKSLIKFCEAHHLPHIPFKTFQDIIAYLDSHLDCL